LQARSAPALALGGVETPAMVVKGDAKVHLALLLSISRGARGRA